MAGGRPRSGSARQKNGLWYASVAPAPGQRRKEVAFGRDEAAARAWLRTAVAAQADGQQLPAAQAFLTGAAPAAPQTALPAAPAITPTVLGLDGGLVPGRGHDANAVFRGWLRHQYRNLEAGGGLRETNVVSYWEDHVLPFLLEHGEKVGSSGVFCIEELHLTLAGELRGHLLRGARKADGSASPAGPTLHGSVTVREAVAEYGLPKSTVENYRKAGRFPNATNASGVWLIPREDLRQAGLLAADRPGRGRPTNGTGLAGGTTANLELRERRGCPVNVRGELRQRDWSIVFLSGHANTRCSRPLHCQSPQPSNARTVEHPTRAPHKVSSVAAKRALVAGACPCRDRGAASSGPAQNASPRARRPDGHPSDQ